MFCRRFPQLCQEIRTYDVGDYRVPTLFDTDDIHPHHPDFFNPPSRRLPMLETPSRRPSTLSTLRAPTRSEIRAQKDLENLLKKGKAHLDHLQTEAWKNLKIDTKTNVETIDQHKYARFADIAYAQGYREPKRVKEILEEGSKYIPDMSGFEIDRELSTPNETILHNPETGEVHVAYRGSDTKFFDKKKFEKAMLKSLTKSLNKKEISPENFKDAKAEIERIGNVYDWYVNAMTGIGQQHKTQRYKDIVDVAIKTAKKYNISPRELTLSGHSKGGGEARYVAEQLGVKDGNTHIFDAADTPLMKYVKLGEGITKAPIINAYRTPQGVVSSGHVLQPKEHLNITTITPLPGNEDIIKAHGIDNYYTNNPKVRPDGNLEVSRVGNLRNMIAGSGSMALGAAGGVALSEVMLPSNEIKSAKSQGFAVVEGLKGTMPELEPGGTLADFLDLQGFLGTPEEKRYVATKVFGADPDPEPYDPKNDSALTKWLNKVGGVRKERLQRYEDEKTAWAMRQMDKGVRPDYVKTGLPEQPEWVKRVNEKLPLPPEGYVLGEA